MKGNIAIVDDDLSLRELLELILKKEGYTVSVHSNGQEALNSILPSISEIDVVVTDIIMPQIDGIALLQKLKFVDPDIPVIVITANTRIDYAVEALKQGAHDYITKPFNNDELKIIVKNAIEKRNLQKENIELKKIIKKDMSIVFKDKRMEELYMKALSVASTTAPVLIIGESGTGKELFARLLHTESQRTGETFFAVNCAAIPETLMESEFFGFEKGAFTGASMSKPGYFELAHKGTLFLDEIGDLPVPMQAKLLRAIEDKSILRLGSKEPFNVDVRIIAATNKNIEEEVKRGAFREDLYYRLHVIKFEIPPLRERKDDIVPLAMHYLRRFSIENTKQINGFTKDAIKFLETYHWPGNVRELQNVIERACIFETGNIIGVSSLPVGILTSSECSQLESNPENVDFKNFSLEKYLTAIELNIINKALQLSGGNKKSAADLLGISLWSLYHRLDKTKNDIKDAK